MDASQLLLEYLKEQYTQARQHETRQTAATTFLTAAAAAVLGLGLNEKQAGILWWVGLIIVALGLANLRILAAHQIGQRFHTKLAGRVRKALEARCSWEGGATTTTLRRDVVAEMKLGGPKISIGNKVYEQLRLIPMIVVAVGAGITLFGVLISGVLPQKWQQHLSLQVSSIKLPSK